MNAPRSGVDASPRRSLLRRWLPFALILCGVLLISAASWFFLRPRAATDVPLPKLGEVPDFSLIDSDGRPFTRAQLAGGIWVADFIFTQCPSICPTLSAQMAKLQRALPGTGGDAVRLVSFSVDPANDTPEALRTYATRFGAEPERWRFVTGDRAALYALIGQGFRLAVAERQPSENTDGEGLITHSDRFVLVDASLQIRGYYHGTEPGTIQQLRHDIATLRREAGS